MPRPRRAPLACAALGVALALLFAGSGRATIEEQRARLPPPARCEDPVAGVWRAHHYTAASWQWYLFTLEVRRSEANSAELTGMIRSQFWMGTAKQQTPPPCDRNLLQATVEMPAKGRVDGTRIAFGGTGWRQTGEPCGIQRIQYLPDQLTGEIDARIQEFQSVNNDGGSAVNEPMVFRRVECFEPPKPARPKIVVTPPPLVPELKKRGCNAWFG
jgi:hypothetical protein